MKKILIFVLVLSICLVPGCEKENKEKSSNSDLKINLNDNIYYYEDLEITGKNCGGYGFPSNAEDVLDKRWIATYFNMKSVDKMELFMHDNILFDEEKETKKEWDKLEKPARGVKDFDKGYTNHEFYIGYWYIGLVKDEEGTEFLANDNYYELSQNLKKEVEAFNERTRNIIEKRNGYRLNGTCGGPALQMNLLDEEVCNIYNLNCDRW